MAEQGFFECPSCGAKLSTNGMQAQITCEYCGNAVTVPEDLRAKPAAPARTSDDKEKLAEALVKLAGAAEAIEAERIAEGRAPRQSVPSPVRQTRRGGCGCLFLLLVLGALVALAYGLVPGVSVPPQVSEVLGITSRALKPEVVNRPLQGTLPRDVSYASLVFSVKAAAVTNKVPGSSSQAPQYRSDQAYAELDLMITNPLTTKTIYLGSDVARLQLADGKSYKESSDWSGYFDRQASNDTRLIFDVPYASTLEGAKLILQEPNKEPATLSLDGPAPVAHYPVKLAAGEHATVGTVNYTVLSATLDLDADGKRADAGKRFLLLQMRVENTSDFRGGMALGGDHFRLLVDGVPRAPDVYPSELVEAKSSLDVEVVFAAPDTATKAELQVGEVGREKPATIPFSLTGAK